MSSQTAILVVDVQVAMFNLGVPLYKSNSLLENIKHLVNMGRSSACPIIFVQHSHDADGPFKRGTTGWGIHPDLCPQSSDYVIEKHHPDSFQNTPLSELLTRLHINHLVVCGLVTEGCVDTTIRRANSLGYKVTFVSDAHSTTDGPVLTAEQIVKHHSEVLKIFSNVRETARLNFNEFL